jgi:hypothetical protein
VVSRVQNIRSTNKNTRPPNATRQPGEFYVNFADKQFGVIDTAQVPQDLIAIRFHSANTDYAVGDHVIYQGRAYRAKQVVPASVFNPTYWETAGMADAPADSRLYGRYNNTWDVPGIEDIFQLQTALDAKAPLVSPAFSNTPTAPTAPAATNTTQIATTAFVKSQGYATIGGAELTAKVNIAGDTMTGPLTLNAAPTVPLHAATKAYVDAKPSGANTNDNPPSAPVNGQLWWETDTGSLFIYYDDGNSQAWVQLNASVIDAYTKAESDTKYVDAAGDTMTGPLKIIVPAGLAPLNINKPATGAFNNTIVGSRGGVDRWGLMLGDSIAETGSNIGTNFGIYRCTDAGAYVDTPLSINRATGLVTIGAGSFTGGGTFTGGSLATLNTNHDAQGGWPFLTEGFDRGWVCLVGAATGIAAYFTQGTINNTVGAINLTATTTSYVTSSSAELKEDLQSFDAGRIIDDTEVYDFKWKDADERSYGVLAQQAVEIYPQAVTHVEEEDFWGVDYSKYVPVILQELKALRARVAELEGDKAPVAPKKGH